MKFISALVIALPFAAHSATPGATVTFNRQIAPIIYQNCSACHRPGEAAPFALLSYNDVAKRANTIAKVTASHVMPPWKAEPGSYAFRDERRLTGEQIALIRQWVDDGMPEGNAAEKPEPPKFASGWQLGEPDLIVEMPAAYHVPADGPDIYRNLAVPLGLTEDKWITAIDMRPSARGWCITSCISPMGAAGFTRSRSRGTSRVSAACARAALPFRLAAGRSAGSRISFPKDWR